MKIGIFTGNLKVADHQTPWCSHVKMIDSAKAYPFWQQLVGILQYQGHELYQFMSPNGTDTDMECNYKLIGTVDEIVKILPTLDLFISVDTFLPHLVVAKKIPIKGIVIWSLSDPKLFGYEQFINVSKKEYFRKDQYNVWIGVKRVKEAFPTAIEVAGYVSEIK